MAAFFFESSYCANKVTISNQTPVPIIILPENWTVRLVKIFNNLTLNYEKGHKTQIQSVVQG